MTTSRPSGASRSRLAGRAGPPTMSTTTSNSPAPASRRAGSPRRSRSRGRLDLRRAADRADDTARAEQPGGLAELAPTPPAAAWTRTLSPGASAGHLVEHEERRGAVGRERRGRRRPRPGASGSSVLGQRGHEVRGGDDHLGVAAAVDDRQRGHRLADRQSADALADRAVPTGDLNAGYEGKRHVHHPSTVEHLGEVRARVRDVDRDLSGAGLGDPRPASRNTSAAPNSGMATAVIFLLLLMAMILQRRHQGLAVSVHPGCGTTRLCLRISFSSRSPCRCQDEGCGGLGGAQDAQVAAATWRRRQLPGLGMVDRLHRAGVPATSWRAHSSANSGLTAARSSAIDRTPGRRGSAPLGRNAAATSGAISAQCRCAPGSGRW